MSSRSPLLVVSTGCGLVAQAAEAGGADFVAAYSSGRARMRGLGSLAAMLPFERANEVVFELVREIVAAVSGVPVLAAVCATDPRTTPDALVHELARSGAAGVQNFPSIGLVDGVFRSHLEETGFGFEAEVELMDAARRAGLLACPFVFDEPTAQAMARARPTMACVHLGVTGGRGDTSALSTLDEAIVRTQMVVAAIDGSFADRPSVLVHGGSVRTARDLAVLLQAVPEVSGFVAGSSIERDAIASAVAAETGRFKSILRGRAC
ncbi:MAG: phosphoenolpyruvate hydrolase family protein [Acidimicrobiia bacterium]